MTGVVSGGVECPKCTSIINEVKETRQEKGTTKRRRRCFSCGHKFLTREWPEPVKPTFSIDEKHKQKMQKLIINCKLAAEALEEYIKEMNK